MVHRHRLGLMLVLVLAACDSGTPAPAPGTPPPGTGVPGVPAPGTPAPAPGGAGLVGDDRTILITAFRNGTSRKVRARATMTTTGGPHAGTSSWIGEMVPPDLKRMDMTLPTGDHMQMVVSSTQVYMRRATTGPWASLPAGMLGPTAAPDFERQFIAHLEDGTATFTRAGTEMLGARSTTVFNLTSTAPSTMPGAPPSTVTGRVWIGNADNLVYKFEGDIATPAAHVVITYEYDDSITITIPPTP